MPIATDDLYHLLRRTEFAVRPARRNALAPLTREQAVDNIMAITENPAMPASLLVPNGGYPQYQTFVHWWLERMRASPRPFQERMTAFWFGHFTSAFWDVGHCPSMANQNKLYRSLALGDYRTLTSRMAIEPAMLVYLDNASNTAAETNKNFARELMELFLLGVGNYTEADVGAAARAWAGHSVDWNTRKYVYRANYHDAATATWPLFGHTAHWTGQRMLSHVFHTPSLRIIAAKHIARKLWEHFAYPKPSDALVTSLANTLIGSNWSIKALMRTILLHPEFYSPAAKQGLVRTPLDWVVSVLTHTSSSPKTMNPEWFMDGMGMDPLNPPNVSGWRANEYWLNSSAFQARASFASHMRWKLKERGSLTWVAGTAVPAAVTRMCSGLGYAPSASTRTAMERWMTAQRGTPEGWAEDVNLTMMALMAPEMHQA